MSKALEPPCGALRVIHWRVDAVRIPVTLLFAAMLVVFQCALVMDVKLDDLEKAKNTSNKSEWGHKW